MTAAPIHPWQVILASASPRRRELIAGLDLSVSITRVDVDETPSPGTPLREVAEELAVRKSHAWPGTLGPDQVLITADTTVLLHDRLLNKPADDEEARSMLHALSGVTHEVVTGVCLRTSGELISFSDVASVRFADLSDAEIEHYIRHYSPLDKAGAYGVQDWIGHTGVERIEGSYFTVMGLPTHRVYRAIKELRPT
ncbi:MAG: septum formation protein Maf [Flavobacteriales bacterium]|nr:septum formation protein Maf [Flavobacteriales bacterium]